MERLGKILLLVAFVAYPVLLHTYILKSEVEMWQLLFVFAPLLAAASWVLLRMAGRVWWPLVVLLIAVAVYYVVAGNHERIGLLAVNGLSHATLNLFLLWLFGRTLLRGREPLVSQISRHITGDVRPKILVYTRQVNVAWCIFFALQVVISLLLYLYSTYAAWSFFINVLNLPLLMLMFVGEKAYRTARFPDHPKASILKVIEVYSKDFAVPRKADSKR
jgi:uncharacterized membrane protein